MNRQITSILVSAVSALCFCPCTAKSLRAPAYPLITIDPYTSIWSASDNLYDRSTTHWTGRDFPMLGVLNVDGTNYRFLGKEQEFNADSSKALLLFSETAVQVSADVRPMQTIYQFRCGNEDLTVTFTAPMFLDDLDILSRPVNYVTFHSASNDGRKHDISLYFEVSPEVALDTPSQRSTAESFRDGEMLYISTGSASQQILGKSGDDVRIDWGRFYIAANARHCSSSYGSAADLRSAFKDDYVISSKDNGYSKLAFARDFGKVEKLDWHILVGYDDIFSVQYFGTDLRPYWNRNDDRSIRSEFRDAEKDYEKLLKRSAKFDDALMKQCEEEGGKRYADLCALAYRQALSAQKLVESPDGELLYFSKENFSGGLIGTVDVTYPCSPMLLYYNPALAEAQLNYIFHYSEKGGWNKPFAPHDVGSYPIAGGQAYGDGMPVEESGNMLILTAAIAKVEGNANYAAKHWATLTQWAEFLSQYGFDPENQLCTDDFAGHFAHNANLSVKAILGMKSYSYLAGLLGYKEESERYAANSKYLAGRWAETDIDGDHYKLTFDKPGTWSQKYNLVWDKLLGFNIFPQSVTDTELSYYLTRMNRYGLPLDSRETYTKTDWIIWTATMASDKATFERFVSPVWDFMNETEARVPMSDWVYTEKPKYVGFRARSVVGGYFIKLLSDRIL